jgi:hypothetical protein
MSASCTKRSALKNGDRVEVFWERQGWLSGTFDHYTSADDGEDFRRCMVKMDNGFACRIPGYHPRYVRKA